jgi:CshA-type fibril repeat protein
LTTVDGVYSIDAVSGVITFNPVIGFIGEATVSVTYAVTDTLGRKASTTYTPTVLPPTPATAVPDTSTGLKGILQTLSPLGNDAATQGQTLDPTSIKLCHPGDASADPVLTPEVAPNCTLTTWTTIGEGSFTVVASGNVEFQPEPDFLGVATPVHYQVTDSSMIVVSSTLTPSVVEQVIVTAPPPPVLPPVALPDRIESTLNTAVTLIPDSNDSPGSNPLVPTSILLCEAACDETSPNGLLVVETREGLWSVESETGAVVFTPTQDWHGTATINYLIKDSMGMFAFSSLTVVIPAPEAIEVQEEELTELADSGFSSEELLLAAGCLMLLGSLLLIYSRRTLRESKV